jgi:hypothetical protein
MLSANITTKRGTLSAAELQFCIKKNKVLLFTRLLHRNGLVCGLFDDALKLSMLCWSLALLAWRALWLQMEITP